MASFTDRPSIFAVKFKATGLPDEKVRKGAEQMKNAMLYILQIRYRQQSVFGAPAWGTRCEFYEKKVGNGEQINKIALPNGAEHLDIEDFDDRKEMWKILTRIWADALDQIANLHS
ncbi:hypothetical protein TWF481_002388 [Arthrobotrys musiformis]|uniref:Uncharacterized protein n=1 Tax=Arthrobotrys musiformis TaxID=47236 RepID=A0AAV9VU38_9PEZI